jgi:hypothetical protein
MCLARLIQHGQLSRNNSGAGCVIRDYQLEGLAAIGAHHCSETGMQSREQSSAESAAAAIRQRQALRERRKLVSALEPHGDLMR